MVWKKKLHTEHGTTLLETTVAELWSGKAFLYLETELPKLGLTLDPDPDRAALGRKPIENPRLARTFRSFMTHAKSNRLTPAELERRLDAGVAGTHENMRRDELRQSEDKKRIAESATGNLFNAVRRGDLKAVAALLKAGAAPSVCCPDGTTMIDFARGKGHLLIAALLDESLTTEAHK
jgi:hypothetical protein